MRKYGKCNYTLLLGYYQLTQEDFEMYAGKNILWKLVMKSLKLLFSGIVTLIGLVEVLTRVKGGEK